MRFFGTALAALFGIDPTGIKLSDVGLEAGKWRGEFYKKTYFSKAPLFTRFKCGVASGNYVETENILLPVLSGDNKQFILLCASVIVDENYQC